LPCSQISAPPEHRAHAPPVEMMMTLSRHLSSTLHTSTCLVVGATSTVPTQPNERPPPSPARAPLSVQVKSSQV
jgi:hypothetical protein